MFERAKQLQERWHPFIAMVKKFLPYVKKQSRYLILSSISGIFYVFIGLLEPWPMKLIFDNVFLEKPLPKIFPKFSLSPIELLNILVIAMIVIALVRGIFYYYEQLLTSRAGQQIVSSIRLSLYSHLQSLSFKFHDRRRTGDMLARLTTDIRILRDIFISIPLLLTRELFLMVVMVSIMAIMDWQLTLLALTVIPLLWFLIKKYRKPMKQAMQKQREREGDLSTIAAEVLGAIRVVKGYHREEHEVEKFGSENARSLSSGLKASRLEAKLKWGSELFIAVITALVIAIAGRRVLSGALSPGDIIVFSYYLKTFNRPLRRISKITEQMMRGTASGERILGLLKISPETSEKAHAPPFLGTITFKDVSFGYHPEKNILKGLNFTIQQGEKVAIVGKTGSGKSSLVSLLPRFYPYSSGEILIDGYNINDYSIASIRKQITVVFQEPILFAATIAENIAYGKPEATKEEIEQAAKKAGIDGIIRALPEGYETVLGERGGTLSGGQRQCIAITRSIMKNAPIIILDEPTSGLDLLSAQMVMNALKTLTKGKTVIVISHQKETLLHVDRVLTLTEGSIIEEKEACSLVHN